MAAVIDIMIDILTERCAPTVDSSACYHKASETALHVFILGRIVICCQLFAL